MSDQRKHFLRVPSFPSPLPHALSLTRVRSLLQKQGLDTLPPEPGCGRLATLQESHRWHQPSPSCVCAPPTWLCQSVTAPQALHLVLISPGQLLPRAGSLSLIHVPRAHQSSWCSVSNKNLLPTIFFLPSIMCQAAQESSYTCYLLYLLQPPCSLEATVVTILQMEKLRATSSELPGPAPNSVCLAAKPLQGGRHLPPTTCHWNSSSL